jgi:hypothetical protein
MTKKEINFINRAKATNKKIVAQYLALYTECIDLKKCMITLTPPDSKLSTLLDIRRFFFKKLNAYKRSKVYGDMSIKYFSNIEFTKLSSPHLHIQLYYTKKDSIEKAYKSITSSNYQNSHANNITYAQDNSKSFNYVIKDYMEFDLQREQFKHKFKGINFTSSSHKSISNGVIKYLFKTLTFKTKNRYKEILFMIQKGLIVISNKLVNIKKFKSESKIKNRDKKNKIKFISISKIGIKLVYIYEFKVRRKNIKRYKGKSKMWAFKIKG